jgi:hypothetical protein
LYPLLRSFYAVFISLFPAHTPQSLRFPYTTHR